MDGNKTEFVDKTILNTPKPTATSTVTKTQKKYEYMGPADLENSLGILSLNGTTSSHIEKKNKNVEFSNISSQLQQQRVLANSSLQRANKVAGIPSKYLRPNVTNTSSISNLDLLTESTINESDLLGKSPKNTSTPRTSDVPNALYENNLSRPSLGQSMAQLSYQIGNTDISIDNFVKEFQKAMKTVDTEPSPQINSDIFTPAEDAASMLLADELSWRRKNDIPVMGDFSQPELENASYGKVSMGTFFQQRSDTLSDFQAAVSPVKKKKPVPLVESFNSFSEEETENDKVSSERSLSISAIQKFLAQTEDTPRKVTDYLLNQGKIDHNINDQSLLPSVSKNSSYTTDYSENDAMDNIFRGIVANKENIDTHNIQLKEQNIDTHNIQLKEQNSLESKRSTITNDSSPTASSRSSSRTSSALTSLPNGKLPIESTKFELIWGCVKVDKCVTQDFFLRNKTSKKLCLQMTLSGKEFKIRKDNRLDSDPLSAAKIVLLPHESRVVIVSFIPTKTGAAADELSFTSLDSSLQQTKKQCIRLFGYGGYGKIEFDNLTKDTGGKFWLSLGKLDDQNMLQQSFIVKNSGNLPLFAHISFNARELFAYANVKIVPSFFVVVPDQSVHVKVTYIPSIDDHRVFQQSMFHSTVADLGSMCVLSGTEVNRGRLRRLCRKSAEKNLMVDEVSNVLKEKIQDELMPSDLHQLRESPSNLKEILKLFSRNEIVLTLEQDPEQTLMPQYPDDSGMFQSLCHDGSTFCMETSMMPLFCKLEPASIILTPPTKMRDNLFLISEGNRRHHFHIGSNPEGLDVFPKEGVISPGQEMVLNLTYPLASKNDKLLYKVLVYIENEVLEATVKIMFIQSREN